MDTFDKDEFWRALGRLSDDTLELKASITELRASTNDLFRIASIHQQSLLDTEESLVDHEELLNKHERRHDRTEVTVQSMLDDMRRLRGNRPPA